MSGPLLLAASDPATGWLRCGTQGKAAATCTARSVPTSATRVPVCAASSQTGIKQAIQGNLFGIATGVPARLSEEPGVSLLAGAVEAYFYTYPGKLLHPAAHCMHSHTQMCRLAASLPSHCALQHVHHALCAGVYFGTLVSDKVRVEVCWAGVCRMP